MYTCGRTEMDRRMTARKQQVERKCLPKTNSETDYRVDSHAVFNYNSKFVHCPVAKAASTFWFRCVGVYRCHQC